MSVSDVDVAIVGLGGMGSLHARTMSDLGASVVAGVDPIEERRQQFSDRFDGCTYDSHEALLTDQAVDAVVVTTPNRFHEPIAVDALETDTAVLVEKPLAHTLESAERIAAAEANSAAHCMVGFHNRYAGSMALFDAQKADGRFGDLLHVEANYVRRRGVPRPGSWFTNADLAGGGALLDIGVHALDSALYALDFPEITEVSGVTRSTYGMGRIEDPEGFTGCSGESNSYDVDDSVSAFVRCGSGQTISLEAAWATNRESSMDVFVRGTDAGARFELGDSTVTILEAGTAGGDHYSDVTLSGNAGTTGYGRQDELFLQSVANGVRPRSNTVEEALTVQRVIDAIYLSSETGRAYRFDGAERSIPARAD